MLGGDFNYTSHRTCLMLEKVNAKMYDQDTDAPRFAGELPTADTFRSMFEAMGKLHAHFRPMIDQKKPGLSWLSKPNGAVMKAVLPVLVKKSIQPWQALLADPGPDVPPGPRPAAPRWFVEECLPHLSRKAGYAEFVDVMQSSGLTTLVHGDERLDNWYFGEGDGGPDSEVGLLDWQLVSESNCCTLLPYIGVTSSLLSKFPAAEYDSFVDTYWSALQSNGGAPGITKEDFLEQVGLFGVLVSGCKNEIGAANVSPDDPKAKRFFHSGALALFAELEKHNTEALWRR